jgi:pre-rRNA-processing protein TSR1
VFVRDARPHLLVDKWDFVPQNDDHEMGLLKVTGYIRGRTLSVNQLVHIPLFGDHQLLRIESHPEPCSLTKGNHVTKSSDEAMIMECNESNETSMEDKDITVLGVADSTKQVWYINLV